MDLAAKVAALLEQTRAQAAFNTALSSKVDELTSTVARVSTENAQLSSEVQRLGRELRAEQKTNVELSKAAAPAGHWVWEPTTTGGGEEGRWVWSLERHSRLPSTVAGSGPPATLLSLPVEVFSIIFGLLPSRTRRDLCSVCMRLLELASSVLRRCVVELDENGALDFISCRLEKPKLKGDRVSPLLLPPVIRLAGQYGRSPTPRLGQMLQQRLESRSDSATLDIDVLGLELSSAKDLCGWAPFLLRFNPSWFILYVAGEEVLSENRRPSTFKISRTETDNFSASWDRLELFMAHGARSVLISREEPHRLALGDRLRSDPLRGPDVWRVGVTLVKRAPGKEKKRSVIAEEDVVDVLGPSSGLEQEVDEGSQVWLECEVFEV